MFLVWFDHKSLKFSLWDLKAVTASESAEKLMMTAFVVVSGWSDDSTHLWGSWTCCPSCTTNILDPCSRSWRETQSPDSRTSSGWSPSLWHEEEKRHHESDKQLTVWQSCFIVCVDGFYPAITTCVCTDRWICSQQEGGDQGWVQSLQPSAAPTRLRGLTTQIKQPGLIQVWQNTGRSWNQLLYSTLLFHVYHQPNTIQFLCKHQIFCLRIKISSRSTKSV